MTFFLNTLVDGLTHGAVYALLALGYSMVYGTLKLLNFAHGEVYMMGAFTGFGVLTLLGGPSDPIVPTALVITAMFIGAMLVSGVLGVGIERFAYRPLRNAPRIAPLISALGVSFFLQNTALLLFSAQIRTYDTPQLVGLTTGFTIFGVYVWLIEALVWVLAAGLMIGLMLLIGRTGSAARCARSPTTPRARR